MTFGPWGRWSCMPGAGRSVATGGGFQACRVGGGPEPSPVECFPCALRHGGLRSGIVGVVRGAGEEFLRGSEAVAPLLPARSPCTPHPAAELPQGGGGPQGEVGGGG